MPLNNVQRIQRRARQAERDSGHWLLKYDGPDLIWSRISSSTGRVGHLTGLQFDVVSIHYAAEVKNILMSQKLQGFWKQIREVAIKHGKSPLLIIQPSNPVDKSSTWHVITPERHAELLEYERRCNGGTYEYERVAG